MLISDLPVIKFNFLYYFIYFLNYNLAGCLYGCETWSLTLREEWKPRVFENKLLRGIFGNHTLPAYELYIFLIF